MNKVGIYFAYWTRSWKADYIQYIDKVSRLGFDVLEICTSGLPDCTKEQLQELARYARDKELELTFCEGFSADKDLASSDAYIRQQGIDYAKRVVEAIGIMGGKVFGGINYSAWPGVLNEGITDKRPMLARCIQSMKQVAKTAEDCGVEYCVEVVNRFEQYLINTSQEAVAFVDEIGSPNVKILLDTFHMNIEEDSIYEAVLTAGHRLGHVHIGENNRKTPGMGRIPWDELTAALAKIGYNGRLVMEPFMKMGGDVGRDIRVWRDLSGNADEAAMDGYAKDALTFIRSKL